MQQQKNILLFFVLALLIWFGGLWIEQKLGLLPERKPQAEEPPAASEKAPALALDTLSGRERARALATLQSALAGPASGLSASAEAALIAQAKAAAVAKKPPIPPPPQAQRPKAPHREFTLGHSSWPITARLTSYGAGVRQLLLNRFQKADKYGRPVWEADGKTPVPMELIPDDTNRDDPSFRLYLYAQPKDEHPVATLGEEDWQVDDKSIVREDGPDGAPITTQVAFYTEIQGLRITKTFRLAPGQYHIELEVKIENRASNGQWVRYQLAGAHGLPIEGEWYTGIYRNGLIGWLDAKGNALRQLEDSRELGVHAGGNAVDVPPESERGHMRILWGGVGIQYFASVAAVDNDQQDQAFLERARATVESEDPDPKRQQFDDITVRLITVPLELKKPGSTVVHKYLLYNGPLKVALLGQFGGERAVSPELVRRYEDTLHFNTFTDYHSSGWFGTVSSKIYWSNLLIYCTNVMHWLLGKLHQYVMPWSWGLCIILLTVLVRGAMFPVSRKQALMSIKMQELAPELAKLKEKFKDDQQALARAQWELYGRHGVNPIGGCLPMLLQMPVFLGLYYALQESIHFRLEPLPILGSYWIQNLAAPDMLVWWGEHIPLISVTDAHGSFFYLGPYFNLLPVVAVVLMMISTMLMTPPAADEQQAMQQKMMKYMMIFFGLMFYKVAAGLCLYFIATSVWGIAERKLLPKRKPALATGGASGGGGSAGRPVRSRPRGPRPSAANGDGVGQRIKDWWQEILRKAEKR
jgi:YidC/Oxa1 family membrane protein insertase